MLDIHGPWERNGRDPTELAVYFDDLVNLVKQQQFVLMIWCAVLIGNYKMQLLEGADAAPAPQQPQ